MSADQQGGALKPVTPARVAEELRKLSTARSNGELDKDEYEHRFSRMISELRDRRIDGNRAEILSTLTPLLEQGVVSADDNPDCRVTGDSVETCELYEEAGR